MSSPTALQRDSIANSLERTVLKQLFLLPLLYDFTLEVVTEKGSQYVVTLDAGAPGEYRRRYANPRVSRKGQTPIEYIGRQGDAYVGRQTFDMSVGYSDRLNRLLVFDRRNPPRISSRLTQVTFMSPLLFEN